MPTPVTSSIQYSKVNAAVEERQQPLEEPHFLDLFKRYRSLTWMILSWLSGLAVAIGHHFFYARFNNKRVDETSISQEWVIRIGTGMAYFVQTLLVVSASIACTQQQWLTARSKPFKVRQVDTIFSILGNALAFLETRVWLRHPLLSFLAAVAWLLPIAALITPATISVVPNNAVQNVMSSTPRQLYFNPNQYGTLQTLVRSDYLAPSPNTVKAAYGSALTGQILPIPVSEPNMSYTLSFDGPAVHCEPASSSMVQDVYKAYMDQLTGIENQYHYISWVPTTSGRLNLTSDTAALDLVSTDAAHIYIIPNTSVAGPIFVGGEQITPSDSHYGYEDLIDCSLYNASYTGFFNFSYPQQHVDIRSLRLLNPVNVSTDISQWMYPSDNSPFIVEQQAQRICYQSIMESFGKLLVGYEWERDGFTTNEKTSWNMLSIDWTSRVATQRGLEELFQNITLSMLGTSSLTMNKSMAESNKVLVNIYQHYNVYIYYPRDLWLAYGIAAAAAFLCIAVGIYAMWRNGACYQTVYSTFIRATKDKSLMTSVHTTDSGPEPLPKELADVRLILGT